MTLLLWTLSPFFNTASAKAYPVGRLAIGYGLLPAAVRSFRHQFPDVRLMLHEMTTTEQIEALHDKCKHLARATQISGAIKSRYTIQCSVSLSNAVEAYQNACTPPIHRCAG